MKTIQYRYPADALCTGSSLGNLYAFARLSATTDLLGLWSSTDNQYYAGEWAIRILAGGAPLMPQETVFTPTSQTTVLTGGDVRAEQTFFLPLVPDPGLPGREADQRIAVFHITVHNQGSSELPIVVRHDLTFPAVVTDRFTKQPTEDQQGKQVRIHRLGNYCTIATEGRPAEARVFGSNASWTTLSSDDATLDADYVFQLGPGKTREMSFLLSFSPKGTAGAVTGFRKATDVIGIRDRTAREMDAILSRTEIFTPSGVINRAIQWAKVNMVRVRHRYRIGEAFTNDPPQDIVVVRDLAWFALGSDYLCPDFSRTMLDQAIAVAVHEGGKLTEFYHADEEHPVRHDYHLEINDDTPLFVWALAHHCMTTGDARLLDRFYPVMKRACDWIIGQTREGLVRCETRGTNVWGICGWRNIIDDYNLAGAVTEINAECALALSIAAESARRMGRTADADRFSDAARRLREEMNRRLVSERTGMYLLNLDTDGNPHHDVTGDLIFPLLAGVADGNMEERILERLTRPDMWTEFGARTVSPLEAGFDPDAGYQLIGGVWPNLTAWIAFCLRRRSPEKVAEAMINIYRISEAARPADYGFVVPGEFPERLHGTRFQSRGMTLSPWTPPTYLWLAVEGLLGARCTWDEIEMTPAMGSGWGWIAVKNLALKGKSISAFLFDNVLYATHMVKSKYRAVVGEELKTCSENPSLFTQGLVVDGERLLFACSDSRAEGVVRVECDGKKAHQHVSLSPGEAVLVRLRHDDFSH